MKLSSKNRLFLPALLLLLIAITAVPVYAQKLNLRPLPEKSRAKQHPHTHLLRTAKDAQQFSSTKSNFSKLLVILVDFQEDDDPLSTGNGKFQLEPDPTYIYSVGAPPHDREYFEYNLEAMRYYYKAVSAESFDLDYDVWPKDKAAYTLSHKMSYYNPPNASSTEFVAKMEEYFKEAFETADRDDPDIVFGDYAHFMIIHAGSDWQHDVLGDSPVDIPSFFIRVKEGKQAVVDGGATEIFHACNVPATISQDFRTQQVEGVTVHSGYGALNSVLFHEFGHSLGLVDLYNVMNFRPMVGAFDIMDSGGAGIMVDKLENKELVYVEGVLPALPGAFSRALLFEDNFRERGLMKDITELKPYTTIHLAGSSKKQTGTMLPTIIKFPLNEDEYYLIENRSLDPDNDGGTAVHGALDDRVIMYPTREDDGSNLPTYEYDYLLPSFVQPNGFVRGGGILVWYVNEKVIYQEGRILEDGSFWSNFENNSVNTDFTRPGVMVLEADGIRDLGELYSWYWTGTPYEYFHARKPILNADGDFVQWSNQPWRPRLSAQTSPAMLGENGLGSLYFLDKISDPVGVMSFELKAGLFDETVYNSLDGAYYATEPINTQFSDISIPHLGLANLRLISSLFDEWLELEPSGQMDIWSFDYPPISVDSNGDGFKELIGIKDSAIRIMDYASSDLHTHYLTCSDNLGRPMVYGNAFYTFSSNTIYRIADFEVTAFKDIRYIRSLGGFDDKIIVLKEYEAHILDAISLDILKSIPLPESFGDYESSICMDAGIAVIYLTANSGNIYRYSYDPAQSQAGMPRMIFRNHSEYKPSQPALLASDNKPLKIFFGLGNYAYVLSYNGMLESGFPRYLGKVSIKEYAASRALFLDNENILHLPVSPNGYYALTDGGDPRNQYSLILPDHPFTNTGYWSDIMVYDADSARLVWYYTLPDKDLQTTSSYIHTLTAAQNPILWNGFRNSGGGVVQGILQQDPGAEAARMDAYVFPNPVKQATFRLRVLNAPAATNVDIYDISGIKVQAHSHQDSSFDLELDSDKLSSGVYLVRVSSGKHTKNFKFAVEK